MLLLRITSTGLRNVDGKKNVIGNQELVHLGDMTWCKRIQSCRKIQRHSRKSRCLRFLPSAQEPVGSVRLRALNTKLSWPDQYLCLSPGCAGEWLGPHILPTFPLDGHPGEPPGQHIQAQSGSPIKSLCHNTMGQPGPPFAPGPLQVRTLTCP